eukprot:g11.t1
MKKKVPTRRPGSQEAPGRLLSTLLKNSMFLEQVARTDFSDLGERRYQSCTNRDGYGDVSQNESAKTRIGRSLTRRSPLGRKPIDHNLCTVDIFDKHYKKCVYTPVVCDDDNDCTFDSCDPETGRVFEDISARCYHNSKCIIDGCKRHGGCWWKDISQKCDDDDECTEDWCDAEKGCMHKDICHKNSWAGPGRRV